MNNLPEYNLINNINNSSKILKHLKKIGRISSDVNYEILIKLLSHKNKDVRLQAIKNLGKIGGLYIEECIINHFFKETNSMVKRECISSLGRQRNKERIDFFIKLLSDKDPKIVLQAIRALLVFKNNKKVKKALDSIKNHPNEMIKEVLEIELSERKKRQKEKHTYVKPFLKNTVVNGDVLEVLKEIKSESFHLTFTSPPYYNARDYSFYSSYKEYLNFLRNVFKEVNRLTKNGRFLIVNSSPVIEPRFSRKHSSKRYPIPFDIHNFLIKDGWEFIDDIIWEKPEYSVKNRVSGFRQYRKPLTYKPNTVTEYLMVYRKKSRDLIDWNIKQYDYKTIEESKIIGKFETNNVWKINPTFDKTHSAVFPSALCDRVIKYYSYIGDLIFDPFAGSGTLAKSALKLNRTFFITEINNKFIDRIKEKLYEFDKTVRYLDKKKFFDLINLNNENKQNKIIRGKNGYI